MYLRRYHFHAGGHAVEQHTTGLAAQDGQQFFQQRIIFRLGPDGRGQLAVELLGHLQHRLQIVGQTQQRGRAKHFFAHCRIGRQRRAVHFQQYRRRQTTGRRALHARTDATLRTHAGNTVAETLGAVDRQHRRGRCVAEQGRQALNKNLIARRFQRHEHARTGAELADTIGDRLMQGGGNGLGFFRQRGRENEHRIQAAHFRKHRNGLRSRGGGIHQRTTAGQ